MPHDFKYLQDMWVRENDHALLSPPVSPPLPDRPWEQCALADGDYGRDYAVEFRVTPVDTEALPNGEQLTAGVLLRYRSPDQYYYAGIGGWGAKIFIGKVERQHNKVVWSNLATQGARAELALHVPYHVRAECHGRQITVVLKDNDTKISLQDDTHSDGPWGFRTVRTQARFADITIAGPTQPSCFVIMPFTTALAFVYAMIKDTVEQIGLACHRADEHLAAAFIPAELMSRIQASDLIIADVTGKNANVYYEVGLALAAQRPLILLAQSDAEIAFDLQQVRTVRYQDPDDLRAKLHQAINEVFWVSRRRERPGP